MPSPLAHGIDLVDIPSFRQACDKGGSRFLNRIFTDEEQKYCQSQKDPVLSFAARFAAKEAVAKALGTGIGAGAAFLEIEVTRNPDTRAPGLVLHGNAAATASKAGITRWLISLTHTGAGAMASVIGS